MMAVGERASVDRLWKGPQGIGYVSGPGPGDCQLLKANSRLEAFFARVHRCLSTSRFSGALILARPAKSGC